MGRPADPIDFEARLAGGSNNRQPWLETFVALPGARKRLSGRVEQLLDDPEGARGRSLVVRRLKPHLGTRQIVLPEAEAQIAMRESSRCVVREIELTRVSVSRGNTVVWDDAGGNWCLADHRDPYRRYRADRKAIVASMDFMASTDVRAFFPSLDIGVLLRTLVRSTGANASDFAVPLKLISSHSTVDRRLPIGPELSSVLGNAVLVEADRLLVDELGAGGAVRWVDDIDFGAGSEDEGWALLSQLVGRAFTPLGVSQHPLKTNVVPSSVWTERDPSFVDCDHDDSVGESRLLPRSAVRETLAAVQAITSDPERAAFILAGRLGAMLADSRTAVRTVASLAPGAPHVGDAAIEAIVEHATTPYSDSTAEALLDLADADVQFGDVGRESLVRTAVDSRVPARTRGVAAWVLADADSFDRRMLEGLDEMHRHGARAVLSAAAFAGHSPTPTEVAATVN